MRSLRSFLSLALALTTALLTGCAGGGSSGTGGDTVISGTFRSADLTPLPGVEVSIEGTDLIDTTDEFGEFAMLASVQFENITLNFRSDTINETLTIDEIPAETGFIAIAVEYEPAEGDIELGSIDFEEAPPPEFELDDGGDESPTTGGPDDVPSAGDDEEDPVDSPPAEDPPSEDEPQEPTIEEPIDEPTSEPEAPDPDEGAEPPPEEDTSGSEDSGSG